VRALSQSLSLSLCTVRSLGFSLVSWHFFHFGSAARHLIGRFRTRLHSIGRFCTRLIFIGRFPVPFSVTKVYHSIFKAIFFFFWFVCFGGAIFLYTKWRVFSFFKMEKN
jgi:hypothetical protein